MRLSKIKLAGFKSFVDPTTVPFPTNLMGVVGPNGCGKSNVIDAVRWVMGESSAKNLRGDSMTDVIFNGSTSRKPVGQASIELVFDNSDGKLAGQYAQYNEISIKRTVTRDGQSQYFLNSTRCRRRDITDIFLGTGLGPRSYAIIEQGTISRLIEAKPEEMRNFLEEAAGISKYKERRRETENRIKHTRENLDRLNDLREELDKQLAHLQRQAKTAEKYKEFKQEERLFKGQLQALRWQELDMDSSQREGNIRELETTLEAGIAQQRNAEARIEEHREGHVEATEHFNKVQSEYYGVGADIARLEQTIQHARERKNQLEEEVQQVERSRSEAQHLLDSDKRKLEELEASLAELEPNQDLAREAADSAAEVLSEAEQAMQEWQQSWEEFNHQAAEPSQTAQVERARIQHMEQQGLQTEQRLRRLDEEMGNLSVGNLEEEIATLQESTAEAGMETEMLQEQINASVERLAEQRESNQVAGQQLDEIRTRLQSLRGRHASLEALQQAALGKGRGAVTDWLQAQGLSEARRLAQEIAVDAPWQSALECVLGAHLEAVCIDQMDPLFGVLGSLTHGSITLFEKGHAARSAEGSGRGELFLSKVRSDFELSGLLDGIYVADTLEQALQMRSDLLAHESVITQDGIWLGPGWVRVIREDDEKSGILHREQELKEINEELEIAQARANELEEQLAGGREQLKQLEHERDAQQKDLNERTRRNAEEQSLLSGKQARMEQIHNRIERIRAEQEELREQMEAANMDMEASRTKLHAALEDMEVFAQRREELQAQRETLRNNLEEARQKSRQEGELAHQQEIRIRTLKTEQDTTRQALQRLEQQMEQLAERREELAMQLSEAENPQGEHSLELEAKLEARAQIEEQLGEARRKVGDIDHAIRELERERHSAEQKTQDIRSKLEQLRIGWQELKVRRQTLQESVTEAGFDMQELLAEMPTEATIKDWETQLNDLGQRIQRLGPINLAAIEEYEQQSERKVYLDAQNADLSAALETLENAIRKIDRETRTRFKETFDKVNKGLQEKFPLLFGGGHAYLELIGEDLLDTGVTIMARPPGKRNSTIHLLSGGEKALTAVAMVFAIFELNPSPFCMLDEVDAPLDEANVGRFCQMVKKMSEQVQFIFITHNKATMELATHLAGVTMHEPGVSRLVAVDVDEAVELAAM